MMRLYKVFLWILVFHTSQAFGWGFAAHKQINRYAVFTLPPEMFRFYKHYLAYITDHAVNPDKRRYILEGEAARHYIDLDYYKDTIFTSTASDWNQALRFYPKDVLLTHGTLPWHVEQMKQALTRAFRQKDIIRILKLSTDLGHYLADAHVPLHTTQNYDGQLTGQEGIHGLWETRIPALFSEGYDLFLGQASYITNTQQKIWEAIWQAHRHVEQVLNLERELSQSFSKVKKYSFEQQGSALKKVYAKAYVQAYHDLLNGQVEQQMRAAVQVVGDFWLTCWIDAGKPHLAELLIYSLDENHLKEDFDQRKSFASRVCEE
jgi:hypothetical protein